MNDVLGVLFACLLSELVFEISEDLCTGKDWDLFLQLHNPYRLQAELYFLFSNLMDLGLKQLYY